MTMTTTTTETTYSCCLCHTPVRWEEGGMLGDWSVCTSCFAERTRRCERCGKLAVTIGPTVDGWIWPDGPAICNVCAW